MQRRLMYHHHILGRSKTELINKVYFAQKIKPSKGDFVKQIEEDKKQLKLKLTDTQISCLSKYKYKTIVKRAVEEEVVNYLLKLKEPHSKMKELEYSRLETQKYLKSDNGMSYEEKCTLFKFRVREIDVKINYRNKYRDVKCTLCNSGEDDSQFHLFSCQAIIDSCDPLANNINVEYEDIFDDISKQGPAIKLLVEIMKTRTKLMEPE